MKRLIAKILAKLSPRLFLTAAYYHYRHRFLNLRNPKDLSALWIKKLLSGKINEIYYLADKVEVRKYVDSKGLGKILTKLIGVYDNPADIPFDTLPERFAIKLNYGAGMNIICTNRQNLDIDKTKSTLSYWLSRQEYSCVERHYNLINRKILVEDFIDDGTGGFPNDFKFICLNGKVVCCLVCSERESGHANYLPFDLNWNPKIDWNKVALPDYYSLPVRPNNLSDMIKIAETLSFGIDLVRVDLYSDGNNIWFGEMTLTPAGCIFHNWSNKAMDELGKMFLENRKA